MEENRILKPDVTSDEVRIYEAYLQRIQKEYDLIWSRFKIYFGFNSGLLVIIGYILRPYFTENCFNSPDCILQLTSILGVIGLIFSLAWHSVNVNGNKWQNFFNERIKELEQVLFDNLKYALHHRIDEKGEKKESFFDIDVVHVNTRLSSIFMVIWLFIIILPLILSLK